MTSASNPKSFYLFITGASRGLGRAFSLALAEKCSILDPSYLRICLLSRNSKSQDLLRTKEMLLNSCKSSKVVIETYNGVDLSDMSSVEEKIQNILNAEKLAAEHAGVQMYGKAILINNAGSLGSMERISQIGENSFQIMKEAFDLNITSSLWLSSQFASENIVPAESKVIVNVSSLMAVQPVKSFGMYCAGKAARNMFHEVLAEEEDRNNILVINYAPGPCDTDMQTEICESNTVDAEVSRFARKIKQDGSLVQVSQTAAKLADIVFDTNKVKSGAHIDFYDE